MVLAAAAAGSVASVAPVTAQVGRSDGTAAPPEARGGTRAVVAEFEGRAIDLSAGWQQARACVVIPAAKVRCFRTTEAADAQAAAFAPSLAAASLSCSTPLRLYEHNTYGGRQLMFYSRGYWQNLADYGFSNQMTSYKIGACTAYQADFQNGGGDLYPGPTAPGSNVPWPADDWDNRVSSIYIA
jgi:hypothetical protein